jgi:membrane protease YdiL (CAAX protease family)
MLMDGAGNPFLEAAVPPPALPAPPPAPSMAEDPTGFLPSFWQGFGLVALQLALVVLFMFLFRFLAMVTLGSDPGVAMPMLLSLLPTALSYLVVLWLGRRWARLGWSEAFPFTLPVLPQVAAFLVLVGPLFEELFNRGLVLNGMRRRYSAWKAIGLSTLLFALSHANPWQLATPLAAGAVFGWVVVRTGTLWLPVIGHAVHNGREVFAKGGTLPVYLDPRHPLDTSGWLAALLLTCAGALLLARTTKGARLALAGQALPVPAPSALALGRSSPPRYPPPA